MTLLSIDDELNDIITWTMVETFFYLHKKELFALEAHTDEIDDLKEFVVGRVASRVYEIHENTIHVEEERAH